MVIYLVNLSDLAVRPARDAVAATDLLQDGGAYSELASGVGHRQMKDYLELVQVQYLGRRGHFLRCIAHTRSKLLY